MYRKLNMERVWGASEPEGDIMSVQRLDVRCWPAKCTSHNVYGTVFIELAFTCKNCKTLCLIKFSTI